MEYFSIGPTIDCFLQFLSIEQKSYGGIEIVYDKKPWMKELCGEWSDFNNERGENESVATGDLFGNKEETS